MSVKVTARIGFRALFASAIILADGIEGDGRFVLEFTGVWDETGRLSDLRRMMEEPVKVSIGLEERVAEEG